MIERPSVRKTKRLDYTALDAGGKLPPQAPEFEEAILGAIMLEKEALKDAMETLQAKHFYVDAHQRIFRAMQGLTTKSSPIDLLTVVEELKLKEELEMVGGAYFVTRLTNTVVSTANIEAHARIILQKETRSDRVASGCRGRTQSACSSAEIPQSPARETAVR